MKKGSIIPYIVIIIMFNAIIIYSTIQFQMGKMEAKGYFISTLVLAIVQIITIGKIVMIKNAKK